MGRIFSRIRRGLKRSSSDEMVMAKLPPNTPSRSPSPFMLPPPSRPATPSRAPSPPQYCKSQFPCRVVQQRSLSDASGLAPEPKTTPDIAPGAWAVTEAGEVCVWTGTGICVASGLRVPNGNGSADAATQTETTDIALRSGGGANAGTQTSVEPVVQPLAQAQADRRNDIRRGERYPSSIARPSAQPSKQSTAATRPKTGVKNGNTSSKSSRKPPRKEAVKRCSVCFGQEARLTSLVGSS
jgi:hypothetical protein